MMKGEQGINQSALGRALDLSPPAITKLKHQGMPVHSVEAAQAWRMERQSVARRKRAPAPAPPISAPPVAVAAQMGEGAYQAPPDYNTSRARREAAEAQLAELKLAEERGDLVRASAMRAAASKRYAGLRDALMQMPARVVPMLVAKPDESSMHRILRAEIVAALSHLTSKVE